MALLKGATPVTHFPNTLVIVIFISSLTLGFLLAVKYQPSFPTVETKPTSVESFCAKAGERSVSNFDMTKGKTNPNIDKKDCCSGLKNIADKQPTANNNQNICGQVLGKSYDLCSPCGNGICDSQYEDQCNCPEDCK